MSAGFLLHLSGLDDQGSGAAMAETHADLQVTRVVLGELAPLIDARAPTLRPAARTEMDALQRALLATRAADRWEPPPMNVSRRNFLVGAAAGTAGTALAGGC